MWCQSCGANLRGKRFGLFWSRGIQPLRLGTSQGSLGRTASSSSSRKKPEVVSNEVLPDPFVSAETLKACALIDLHLLAADHEAGSSGSQSPNHKDMWKYGCPKSRGWEGDVESWTGSEDTSSSEWCEHNAESRALSVPGNA